MRATIPAFFQHFFAGLAVILLFITFVMCSMDRLKNRFRARRAASGPQPPLDGSARGWEYELGPGDRRYPYLPDPTPAYDEKNKVKNPFQSATSLGTSTFSGGEGANSDAEWEAISLYTMPTYPPSPQADNGHKVSFHSNS